MITNGYSLLQVEMVNWGNFQGYQKFDIRRPGEGEGLFAAPQASAILGVNGSGKTTLIDALMITLLPFENSVKLGVTNDYELGAGGGRTIKDYVLGKFSSHQGGQGDLGTVFNREKGCSIVLLKFQHNSDVNRYLTLARLWWYSKYKVSETQLGILSLEDLSVSDLCDSGRLPSSPKAFKTLAKESRSEVQVYETMQSYFTALSGAMGGVSRNDFKLLNRAFYVKSISQIDVFIKENMLLATENHHLERLLENVRNGREIASDIENCEKKMQSATRIVRDLEKLVKIEDDKKKLKHERGLLEFLPDFRDLEKAKQDLEKYQKSLSKALALEPDLARQVETAEAELTALKMRIDKSEVGTQIALFEKQILHLQEKISWSQKLIQKWEKKLTPSQIKIPKSLSERESFRQKLQKHSEGLQFRLKEESGVVEELRKAVYELDSRAKTLKEELDHLSQSGSLIPQRIYSIKEQAIRDLKIPHSEIRFFAELIQVEPESLQHRKPVEAVFFAVARNLLCHPKYLQRLTKWLEKTGFRSDITVKRIQPKDLLASSDDLPALETESVLNFVEVLSEEEHPFYHYLWKWCRDVFDYKLVDVEEFKRKDRDRLVTAEGLLKSDHRTMRKLKQDFAYSLGWDTSLAIETKTRDLVRIGEEHQQKRKMMLELEISLEQGKGDLSSLQELLGASEDLDLLCGFRSLNREKEQLEASLGSLREKATDFVALKATYEVEKKAKQALEKELVEARYMVEEAEKRIGNINQYLPIQEERFYRSKPFLQFAEEVGSSDQLIELLKHREESLAARGVSQREALAEVDERLQSCSLKQGSLTHRLIGLLNDHQRHFSDSSVSYHLGSAGVDPVLLQSWQALYTQLESTELPKAKQKWKQFFDQILIDSVKDTLNEIKAKISGISESIVNINEVLKLVNFEELPTEERYLQIKAQTSTDERIRKFRKTMQRLELVLGPSVRMLEEGQSERVIGELIPFVEEFQKEPNYREFVTDVRNHFHFQVHSHLRMDSGEDTIVETFTGARKDAKSSAQTTQLAYVLLASSLAYRFRFHDPVGGQETPRLIVFDEFGGKFDNEKPKEIIKLMNKMGFQSILLSPMSKADLLAENIGQMIFVHKLSAQRSKVKSFEINSFEDYQRLLSDGPNQEASL